MKKIGLIAGSLRKEAYSRKIAKGLGLLMTSDLLPEFISIDELPLYHDHLNSQETLACDQFRHRVAEMEGLCIVTPEINHGMPGCLKNALDIASVSDDGSAWQGKPTMVVSVSTGGQGGISASRDLKEVALTVGMQIIQPCELYVDRVQERLDSNGLIETDKLTVDFWKLALANLGNQVRTDEESFSFQVASHRLMVRLLLMARFLNLKVDPQCSYAQAFFQQHSDAQKLLIN